MTFFSRAAHWTGILGCVLLVGCSTHQLFNEGMLDIKAGRWDVGLAKLEDAARKDPSSSFMRVELRMQREYVLKTLLQEAEKARVSTRFAEARQMYQRALDLEQDNAEARKGLELTKIAELSQGELQTVKDLIVQHDFTEAQMQLAHLLRTDPGNAEAKQLLEQLSAKATPTVPTKPKLRVKGDRLASLDFRDTPLNMVFQALSRTSGLNFVLDKDVKGDAKTSIFLKDLSIETALELVLAQHMLEKKVMGDNTIFIYPETSEKRKRYEDQIVKSFYLSNTDPKQAMNLLKVMLDSKVLFVDDHAKLLVMRDTPEVIHMAEQLIASLDLKESEVMMEVEVVEISRTKLQEIGARYPNQVSLTALAASTGTGGASTAVSAVLDDIFKIKSNEVTTGSQTLQINLRREDTEANILASPRLRARNYEKAKILIGDRVPVITNAVTPTSVGASVVTGSVQYIEVGLKFEVEPTIYRDNEVAMKVNLEVSNIVKEVTGSGGSLAYQIGTRTAVTALRLRDGETQVLGGLISDEDRETANKVPGLSNIPILGRLFGTNRNDTKKTEIVLSITPHIIRHGAQPIEASSQFWYGTENSRGVQPLMISAGENDRMPPIQPKGVTAPIAPASAVKPVAGSTAGQPQDAANGTKAAGGQPQTAAPAPVPAAPQPDAAAPSTAIPSVPQPADGAKAPAGESQGAVPGATAPAAIPSAVAAPGAAPVVPQSADVPAGAKASGSEVQSSVPAPAPIIPQPAMVAPGAGSAVGREPQTTVPNQAMPIAPPPAVMAPRDPISAPTVAPLPVEVPAEAGAGDVDPEEKPRDGSSPAAGPEGGKVAP
jgi:general secretion pathway protein D